MKTVGELKSAILALNPAMKYCPSYIVFYEEHTKKKFKNGYTWAELFKLSDSLSLLADEQVNNGNSSTMILCEFASKPLACVTGLQIEETAKTKKKVVIKCKITEEELFNIAVANIVKS